MKAGDQFDIKAAEAQLFAQKMSRSGSEIWTTKEEEVQNKGLQIRSTTIRQ